MTEDGKNEGNSIADALEETTAPDDDATVQISGTELAAIRQSATSMELTAEELRQINRKRKPAPDEDDDEHDATRTFDRNQLDAMMAEKAEKAEQATSTPDTDPAEEVDDAGLDELSEADMRAIVFGDTPAEGHLAEQTPDVAGEPTHSQTPDDLAPEFDELSDGEFDELPDDDFDELSDDDFDELSDDDFDELSDDDLDELSDDDLDELSDAEFDELAQELSDSTVDEPEALDEPNTPVPKTAPAPQIDAPAPQEPDLAALSDLDDEEDLGSFRGAESRVLLVGGTLASLAMLVVGALRLWGDGYFTVVHPVMAGMFVAVGFLCLGAALIAFLQGRN